MLAGLPQKTIAPLQRVKNAAACMILELGTREYVTASLLQLHWLPVCWRFFLSQTVNEFLKIA